MKVYSFGRKENPAILLLPGTCCHWKSNFQHVIPLLEDTYHVLCVSYDGFDETERTEFPGMIQETKKIESYIKKYCGGHIRAAYGCSLGGSFVGLLASRQKIQMDYGILGSSDLDQSSPFAAKLMTRIMMPLIYPLIRDGKFKLGFLNKHFEKRRSEMGAYVEAFMEMFGGARPYVTKKSCEMQFYSDLITPLPDKLDVPQLRFTSFMRRRWAKNTGLVMNSTLHIQSFTSRICSTRNCWRAIQKSGQSW